MAENSEKNGVNVVIFGSMNPPGEKLKQMTGVAAILRYALPGVDDVEESDDPDSDKEEAENTEENKSDDDKNSMS